MPPGHLFPWDLEGGGEDAGERGSSKAASGTERREWSAEKGGGRKGRCRVRRESRAWSLACVRRGPRALKLGGAIPRTGTQCLLSPQVAVHTSRCVRDVSPCHGLLPPFLAGHRLPPLGAESLSGSGTSSLTYCPSSCSDTLSPTSPGHGGAGRAELAVHSPAARSRTASLSPPFVQWAVTSGPQRDNSATVPRRSAPQSGWPGRALFISNRNRTQRADLHRDNNVPLQAM